MLATVAKKGCKRTHVAPVSVIALILRHLRAKHMPLGHAQIRCKCTIHFFRIRTNDKFLAF
jgi:hypothetical protein